jgi:hypothetical protein
MRVKGHQDARGHAGMEAQEGRKAKSLRIQGVEKARMLGCKRG